MAAAGGALAAMLAGASGYGRSGRSTSKMTHQGQVDDGDAGEEAQHARPRRAALLAGHARGQLDPEVGEEGAADDDDGDVDERAQV